MRSLRDAERGRPSPTDGDERGRSWLELDDAAAARSRASRRRAAALAMADGTASNEHVFIRGNHKTLGEDVPRRFLEVLGGTRRSRRRDGQRPAGTGPADGRPGRTRCWPA